MSGDEIEIDPAKVLLLVQASLRASVDQVANFWRYAPHAQDRRWDTEETKQLGELLDALALSLTTLETLEFRAKAGGGRHV